MKRFVGRHILILSLVVPLGASLVLGGSASAATPADTAPPVCQAQNASAKHGVFFTDWSFMATVSSTIETGGVGVWKMLGHRFVLKLPKGQASISATFHVSTQSTSTKVSPKLVGCR